MKCCSRLCLVLTMAVLATWALSAAEPAAPETKSDNPLPELAEFRTVDTAVTTRISGSLAPTPPQPGYLGILTESEGKDRLRIALVAADSPALKAGLQAGDLLTEIAGQKPTTPEALRDLLQSRAPGDTFSVAVLREDKPIALTVTLDSPSHPLSLTTTRVIIGVQTAIDSTEGAKIERVTPGSPAAEAGLKPSDIIIKINGLAISGPDKLRETLDGKKPGEIVELMYKRDSKEETVKVKLAADNNSVLPPQWDNRGLTPWKRDVYRLAVIPIDYPDVKHNEKITPADWADALFSRGTYTGKSATGQPVYGSMNDYYLEQSCGKFHVEGKVFDPVAVDKKRADYANNPNRFELLTRAVDNLLECEGDDALKDFDGIFFIHAGDRVTTNRGGIYWPHRSFFRHKGKNWSYFICPEGGSKMNSISVISHEFGHMLGLPDLYALPETPGAIGLGIWCTMSVGHGQDGKPLHFSAWCKDQLGWLKPAVIDPTLKQKLILSPIEESPKECFKILIRPDGSEYLLLENRAKRSFDRDLPGEGLLVWRVVDGRPVLEESHGIGGPAGPDRFLASVPFPSKSNTAFTPYTTPSSKSLKGGGLSVYLTNIRKLPDGRITFYIGYEYW
jgi:M6 family metalloprotease-like protein